MQVQQVLLNLITNASDAMEAVAPTDRRIRIITSQHHGRVRVAVSDRGCGLPPGDTEVVFRPFFSTKEQGLGLGLAICRSIVHAHHGRLRAESNDGLGATFILEFPASSSL